MSTPSLFLDPRYAVLLSTARAMLKQRLSPGFHARDEKKLRKLASFVRSVRTDPVASVDHSAASVGSPAQGL